MPAPILFSSPWSDKEQLPSYQFSDSSFLHANHSDWLLQIHILTGVLASPSSSGASFVSPFLIIFIYYYVKIRASTYFYVSLQGRWKSLTLLYFSPLRNYEIIKLNIKNNADNISTICAISHLFELFLNNIYIHLQTLILRCFSLSIF